MIKGAMALNMGFTSGAGQIWLSQVDCRGTEDRLVDCPANPLGQNNCFHFEDVGVRCRQNSTQPCNVVTIAATTA